MFDSCITDCGDGDALECFSARMVRGRKPYRCVECGRMIPAGALGECATGLSYGEWYTFRTCELCAGVRNSLVRGGHEFGRLWEMVAYHLEPWDEDDNSWLDPPTHPTKSEVSNGE